MTITQHISLESQVVATQSQVSSQMVDEVVILNLKDGTYYGLNEVGAQIWTLIQQPQTVAAVRNAIMVEYDVSAEECTADILTLIQELAGAGLVELRNEQPA